MAALYGQIRDAADRYVSRLVRAYRHDTGALVGEVLSSPSDGTWSITTADSSKHFAVVHDQDSWLTYLPLTGANNSTTFLEWSGKAVTPSGDAKISTTTSVFSTGAARFDGTDDFLTLASNSEFSFGTADFSIHGFVRLDSLGMQRCILDTRAVATDTGLFFGVNSSNQLFAFGNNATIVTGTTTALTANTWHHVVLVKRSGTAYLYLNGAQVGSATLSYTITCPGSLVVGRQLGSTSNDFIGYMNDLVIQKGKAQFVSSFTTPTAPFLPSGTDGDPLWDSLSGMFHFEGTNGSTSFPNAKGGITWGATGTAAITTASYPSITGKASSLSLPANMVAMPSSSTTLLPNGTGAWCVEFWVKRVSSAAGTLLLGHITQGWRLQFDTNGRALLYNGTTNIMNDLTNITPVGTWIHLAFAKSGDVITRYVNGATPVSITYTTTFAVPGGAQGFSGVSSSNPPFDISDFRVTLGASRYTANFTAPTATMPDGPTTFTGGVKNGQVYDMLTPA